MTNNPEVENLYKKEKLVRVDLGFLKTPFK